MFSKVQLPGKLYYKYQSDYQIEEILSGTIREGMLKKIAHASFDERLSVVSLLLSGCMKQFREVQRQEQFVEALFAKLKEAGQVLNSDSVQGDGAGTAGAGADGFARNAAEDSARQGGKSWDLLEDMQAETERFRVKRKEAELLTREQERQLLRLCETLGSYAVELKKQAPATDPEAFEILRSLFAVERGLYEHLLEEAGARLEHAFDFMEAAFGDSQEMVIFLTELNTDGAAVAFLQEYECERYDRYNQRLLFARNDREMMAKVEQLMG